VLHAAVDAQRGALAHVLVRVAQRHLVAADLGLHDHLRPQRRSGRASTARSRLMHGPSAAEPPGAPPDAPAMGMRDLQRWAWRTSRRPSVSCRERTKRPGFQSGASSAENFGRYQFSRSLICCRSCRRPAARPRVRQEPESQTACQSSRPCHVRSLNGALNVCTMRHKARLQAFPAEPELATANKHSA